MLDQPKTYWWIVQFEEDGKPYSYEKTEEELADILGERKLIRGSLPFRVWTIRNGQMILVNTE